MNPLALCLIQQDWSIRDTATALPTLWIILEVISALCNYHNIKGWAIKKHSDTSVSTFKHKTLSSIQDSSISFVYRPKDTVLTNYAALIARQRLLEQQNQKKRAEHESTLPHERDPSQQPLATATINFTPQASGFPETHVVVNSDVEILPNHISIYKGKALEDWVTLNQVDRRRW